MSIVTIQAGGAQASPDITGPGDAIAFAQAWGQDVTRVLDLVNASITGEDAGACDHVRQALWHHLLALGNCSRDVLNGLRHIVVSASWLSIAPHVSTVPRLQTPAIAIGSGPSLQRHLEHLRYLQRSCLLVCADSAAPGLMREGIYPHVCTPLERDHGMVGLEPGPRDMVYAGTAVVRPDVVARFRRFLAVPGRDVLGEWVDRQGLHIGSSTGTMAVAVALELTDGPVHLVGHDLCWESESHWTGSTAARVKPDATVLGNDGQPHPTYHWFLAFRDQIAQMAMATGRVFNDGPYHGTGALIPHVKPAHMPATDGPDLVWEPTGSAPSAYRADLQRRAFDLPRVLAEARARAELASTWEQLSTPALCGQEAAPVISALLRPIFVQASLERRIGIDDTDSLRGMREATVHVLATAAHEVQEAM